MSTLTCKQAYGKIIDAYFKDEIQPCNRNFCFCGTLCDNTSNWYGSGLQGWHKDYNGYSGDDFVRMENALLSELIADDHPCYEEVLFSRMCAALEVLKQIHLERGEVIDEAPVFTKRTLQSV